MERLIRRFVLVICMLAVAAQASAEIVLLSQSRSVSGFAAASDPNFGYEEDSDTILASDFGLFEEEISIDVYSSWSSAHCSAAQNSEVQTGHFSIHGSAATAVDPDWWSASGGNAVGRSEFEVIFEVLTPTPFSLIGSLATTKYDRGSFGGAELQLDLDGETYLSFYVHNDDDDLSVSEVGILEPGVYTLILNATTDADSGEYPAGSSSSFDIDFLMVTPVATDEMAWGQIKALYR